MIFIKLFNIFQVRLSTQVVLMKQFPSAKYSMDAADTEVDKTDKYSALIRLTGNLKRRKCKLYTI